VENIQYFPGLSGIEYLAFGNSALKLWPTWHFFRFLSLSRACNNVRFSVRYTVFLWSVLDLPLLGYDYTKLVNNISIFVTESWMFCSLTWTLGLL